MINKNIRPFLRFLAILCVLLILLLFIANATYRKSFTNENKYKEKFSNAFPIDPALKNPITPGLPKPMVDDAYSKAIEYESQTNDIYNNSNQSLNLANSADEDRKRSQEQKVQIITDTKNKVKEYSGNVARLNQKLYNMRNGDSHATNDIDKVGTFDATLYL